MIILLLFMGQPDTECMTYVMMYDKGKIVASRSSSTGTIEFPVRDYDYIRVVQTKNDHTISDHDYYNPAPTTIQRVDHLPKGKQGSH